MQSIHLETEGKSLVTVVHDNKPDVFKLVAVYIDYSGEAGGLQVSEIFSRNVSLFGARVRLEHHFACICGWAGISDRKMGFRLDFLNNPEWQWPNSVGSSIFYLDRVFCR